MSTTITYVEKAGNAFFTISELNDFFTQLATVINGKLDRRGDTLLGDVLTVNSSIINVPPPEEAGDLERNP